MFLKSNFERAGRGDNARLNRLSGGISAFFCAGGNVYAREIGAGGLGEQTYVVSADEALELSDGKLLVRSRDYLTIQEKE